MDPVKAAMSTIRIDESFAHYWKAEVLPARPAILPARNYVYPRQAEEVERGALEVLITPGLYHGAASREYRPSEAKAEHEVSGHDFSRAEISSQKDGASAPERSRPPFLATCALGFRDPAVPSGIWSAPSEKEICAVSGGYAYIVDTAAPEQFTMIHYRPVLAVRAAVEAGLLLFVGSYSILAWGRCGQAWESERLSDEGVTITGIDGFALRGTGWQMMADKETAFTLDLRSGMRVL
jgi:hypothetical protein